MKQLSGTDTMFLQFERGNNFTHVASLALYDQSTAPGGGVRFKDVLQFFAARVAQFPQFRRRLVRLAVAVDRPYWVEDAGFDVEFHVRHIALPHPGDWRQLCIQVARLHSRPLDRSKPLWEAYVIEGLQNVPGLPPNSFALYTKMHHSIIDGESGSELLKALHSLSPEPLDLGAEVEEKFAADREPTAVELYSRAVLNGVERLPAFARFTAGAVRRLAALGAEAVAKRQAGGGDDAGEGEGGQPRPLETAKTLLSGDTSPLVSKLYPKTRFSGDVSAHRVFEAVGLPLDQFKVIRQRVPGATVNDIFLCVVGGAMRSYLSAKGELPEQSMVAMVPMTLRGKEKGGDRGNQVGFTAMTVHTDVADPLERLKNIAEGAQTSKRVTDAIGKEFARDLIESLPTLLADAVMRNVRLPGVGLICSNVRGPDVPLYMAGARLVSYVPISIAIDGMGLNVTGWSYAGTMQICAVSCRDMLPDPAYFADCMRSAFQELREAAEAAPAAAAEDKPVRKPAARKRKAAAKRAPRKPKAAAA